MRVCKLYINKTFIFQWFVVSLTVSDEDYMIDKFKADLLYYKGQYELGLKIYKNVISILLDTDGQVNQVCIIT